MPVPEKVLPSEQLEYVLAPYLEDMCGDRPGEHPAAEEAEVALEPKPQPGMFVPLY